MDVSKLFHQILKPALGCTEPVAVALASAAACQAAGGWTQSSNRRTRAISIDQIRTIRVEVSRSIFKNGFAISIPNAGSHKGLQMSAALGLFCDPTKHLALLSDICPDHVAESERMVSANRVHLEIKEDTQSAVYIKTEVEFGEFSGAALILGEHSNIACLWRNGKAVDGDPNYEHEDPEYSPELRQLKEVPFRELLDLIEELPESVITLLRETKQKNVNACQVGVVRPMGVGAGYFGAGNGVPPEDSSQYLSRLAAAGSDARMSGHSVEIMTSAGSGNQGITATIPIVVYADSNLIPEARTLRALALSHLVTMYLTTHFGYLSAFCGVAIKAGIGAACGLTYLMGGNSDDLERTVRIMTATLTGMICDGAKSGCALKVSTAAEMATRAAELSIKRAELPDDNGVVGATADETIQNLVALNRAMTPVDQAIVQIMLSKVPK